MQSMMYDVCHLQRSGDRLVDLGLDVGHGRTRPGEVGGAGLGVLGVVVGDGGLDSVLCEHRAVQLNRRQAQLLSNLRILNLTRLIQGHTADQFSQIRRRSNRATTAKSLEDHVIDAARLLVHTDLELHDIATSGSADKTGTNVLVALAHGSDVPGVAVVVEDLFVVASPLGWGGGLDGLGVDGLQASEGSEGTRRHNADAGGDGDETLEHGDGCYDGFEGGFDG